MIFLFGKDSSLWPEFSIQSNLLSLIVLPLSQGKSLFVNNNLNQM